MASQLLGIDALILNDVGCLTAGLGLLAAQTAVLTIVHGEFVGFYESAVANAGEWDAVVGVSKRICDVLGSEYGVPDHRIRLIRGGVEVADVYPRGLKDERLPEFRLAFVGRIDQLKGVRDLPGIISKVMTAASNVTLDVIGGGPELKLLREAFRGTQTRVRFHGALDHDRVLEMLPRFHALVLPTRREGFPLAPLEAMAAGIVPVVTRLPGSTDDMIEAGLNGFLAEPNDLDGFADPCVTMAKDYALWRRLSVAAWQTVKDRFTVECMCRTFDELISELYSARRGGRITRSGRIDEAALGDFASVPLRVVRYARRLRLCSVWQNMSRVKRPGEAPCQV